MMRRIGGGILLGLCMFGQASREPYRNSYKTWRTTAPTLERDAEAGGATLSEAASRVALEASKYEADRISFLQQLGDVTGQTLSWLDTATAADFPGTSPKGLDQFVSLETAAVGRNSDAFANDPDKGIQQLRQALERERAALAGLGGAITTRQKLAGSVTESVGTFEKSRSKAAGLTRDLAANLKVSVQDVANEAAAWAEYYRALVETANVAPTPAPPAPAPPTAPPVSTNVAPPNPSVATSPSRPPAPSITPVPLVRYTGAWTYPSVNGISKGAQPEFLDLLIQEENGTASGTLFGRFKLPPGNTGDPVVRFSFSGEFKNTRRQVFNLESSDGAKGTIELIPGTAFNLLEINFQMDPKPGKIRQSNVVLVKK